MVEHVELLLFFGCSAIITHLLRKQKSRSTATVSELWIYPIKSCQGVKVSSALVGQRGFFFDRILMLIDSESKFVSQRTQPKMALIVVDIDEEAKVLRVSAIGMEKTLLINLATAGILNKETISCTVWGEDCTAYLHPGCGEWFSEFLGLPATTFRLVQIAGMVSPYVILTKFLRSSSLLIFSYCHAATSTDECVRPADQKYAPGGQAAFSDGFAFLVASHKSLQYLNSKLKTPVGMANFRPNIIANTCEAFAEDTWDSLVFESTPPIAMNVVKPCARCKMPSIDPTNGTFDPNNEPTRTIKKFRSGKALGFQDETWSGEVIQWLNDMTALTISFYPLCCDCDNLAHDLL
jgi:uncharacterized protein